MPTYDSFTLTPETLDRITHQDLRSAARVALDSGDRMELFRVPGTQVVETLVIGDRAGQAAGGSAAWGDWRPATQTVRMDVPGSDGKPLEVCLDGSPLVGGCVEHWVPRGKLCAETHAATVSSGAALARGDGETVVTFTPPVELAADLTTMTVMAGQDREEGDLPAGTRVRRLTHQDSDGKVWMEVSLDGQTWFSNERADSLAAVLAALPQDKPDMGLAKCDGCGRPYFYAEGKDDVQGSRVCPACHGLAELDAECSRLTGLPVDIFTPPATAARPMPMPLDASHIKLPTRGTRLLAKDDAFGVVHALEAGHAYHLKDVSGAGTDDPLVSLEETGDAMWQSRHFVLADDALGRTLTPLVQVLQLGLAPTPTRPGHVTVEQLRAQDWDVRQDPADGRLYASFDTDGAGLAYRTPPLGKDGHPDEGAPFASWVHPGWLAAGDFERFPQHPGSPAPLTWPGGVDWAEVGRLLNASLASETGLPISVLR